ncbi:alpha/beta hydrolase [Nocardiopsis halotolerans]|uniref:alpha/beta hydrolase n=1 Tax=Nocardiopsis halotolerans TaxID=124252 RepID=UPI000348B3B1|nr:alpha/beta hydrolase [Nocardiopsis halotolerans]
MTAAGPRHAPTPGPLRYQAREWRGIQLLAHDTAGTGRIVEALGDVATADHIVVLVPGNDNYLGNYFDANRPTRPRANGEKLLNTMRDLAPRGRFAVVVWVGYATPNGFAEAVFRGPAERGADDLARLTHFLPRTAHITLVGHSYGTVVCGLALRNGRVHDCVALGSPGMGGESVADLGFSGNLWAALGPSDWIRFFPRGRLRDIGHGPSPMRPGFGALAFATGDISGHCAYYTEDSESLRNIARIGLGRYGEVSRPGNSGQRPWTRPVRGATAGPVTPVRETAP